MPKFIIWDIKC